MGERGPIPKRSSERRRRNKDSKPTTVTAPSDRPADARVKDLISGRAREVIARVGRERSARVLAAAVAAESRVTVIRALRARLQELARTEHPELPAGTHSIARNWYESLKVSGQAELLEPSDWAAAVFVAEAMTRLLKDEGKISAVGFAAVWSAMDGLLTTEGARRRARVEIERGEVEEPAGQDELAAARKRLQREG